MKSLLIAVALLPATIQAGPIELPYLDRTNAIYEFLDSYVIGLKFGGGFSGKSVDGKVDFDFNKVVSYGNLHTTDRGLSFQMTQLVTLTQKSVAEPSEEKKTRRIMVYACELAERESTGAVLGFCRTLVDGVEDPTGDVFALRVIKISDEQFILEEDQVHYSDFSPTGEDPVPAAMKMTRNFTFDEDNYLQIKVDLKIFDVNPTYREDLGGFERTLRREESMNLYEVEVTGGQL